MKNYLVTVIISTYNRAELLPRAINSVINQTYKNIEIIIVNDGSTDSTDTVIQSFLIRYPNIVYIKHEKTLGGNAARNSGIKAANGEFVAGLDDDDEFLPNRIELLINNYHDKYSLITSRAIEKKKDDERTTKYVPIINLDILLNFNIVGNQVLVRKKRIVEVGMFDETLQRYQDYDMWLRLVAKYGCAYSLPEVTQIIYIGEQNSIALNNLKSLTSSKVFYKKHKDIMNYYQKFIHINNIAKYKAQYKILYSVFSLTNSILINFNLLLYKLKLKQVSTK